MRDLSLYMHFPFCRRRCPYCDFNAHARASIPEEAYVAGMLWRLQSLGSDEAISSDERLVRSIFFGGGTPSLLSPRAVGVLLEGADRHFRMADDCEITLEANPSSAESDKFACWRKAGVNRISLGVQSFDDDTLQWLGRLHDARQARAALEAAARFFTRFSFDLMTALPRQSDEQIKRELANAAAFNSEHLCVYQLTIEKATAFYRAQAQGTITLPSPERAAHLYRLVERELHAHGYANYEISSYARTPEAQARHNLVYWQSGDWLGLGPGAHGRITHRDRRIATSETRDPDRWIRQAQVRDARIEKRNILSQRECWQERVMTGLRLAEGLPLNLFDSETHARINDLCKAGYCEKTAQRLNLTVEGRLRLDTIAAHLLSEGSIEGDEKIVAETTERYAHGGSFAVSVTA